MQCTYVHGSQCIKAINESGLLVPPPIAQYLGWPVVLHSARGAGSGQQRTDRPSNVCSPKHANTANSFSQQEQGEQETF